jgi:uncharacterized damage-inducible protein DinB
MTDIHKIITCLEQTPLILKNLISQIPEELYEVRRIKNRWSIHEHACHVATGEKYGFLKRIEQFKKEDRPKIGPLSGESFPPDFYMQMDLKSALKEFENFRKKVIDISNNLEESIWNKEADHPEYKMYTPYIMLRHLLLHDHFHMYRIEELWLTL